MTLRLMTAAAFMLIVAALALRGSLPAGVLALYLLASIAAYLLYAWDKSAAQRRRRRTPERTLHLLALIGGWPGALIAQQALRHKNRKTEFLAVFWCTVLINCGILWWWLR